VAANNIPMNLLARMMRFLFWLLVVSWSVALLRRAVAWLLRGATPRAGVHGGRGEVARRLQRDPLCGTHVSEEIAFPLRAGGNTLYFCSEKCRQEYASSQRYAANG
jgi:YHS domain-containing protein